MDEKKSWKREVIKFIWPPVENPDQIKSALIFANITASIVAGLCVIFTTIMVFMFGISLFYGKKLGQFDLIYGLLFISLSIIYSLLWVLVWYGLRKMRPIAAIVGLILPLALYITGIIVRGRAFLWGFDKAFTPSVSMAVSRMMVIGLTIWSFVNAIRATLAYQRLIKYEADPVGDQKR